jgi:hypothetical protein
MHPKKFTSHDLAVAGGKAKTTTFPNGKLDATHLR